MAVDVGGLPVLAGMLLFAGATELLLSRLLQLLQLQLFSLLLLLLLLQPPAGVRRAAADAGNASSEKKTVTSRASSHEGMRHSRKK
jgi:hypothetical protein